MTDESATIDLVSLASELTAAWLSNTNTRVNAEDVPTFLAKMHETVRTLAGQGEQAAPALEAKDYTPVVSVRKSLATSEHIISMINGKSYKTLKRHLSTNGMTPDEYRARYGLKADYPMVAPTYAEARRAMAKKIGLGRKPKAATAEPTPTPAPRRKLKVVSPAAEPTE